MLRLSATCSDASWLLLAALPPAPGVDDDKGGLLNPVHAVEAFLKTTGKLPLNVKFLLEGQEEVGSPNLEAFLKQHKDGLLAGADMALSADGGQISATQVRAPASVCCCCALVGQRVFVVCACAIVLLAA